MANRLVLAIVVVFMLLGLLAYSKYRRQPLMVSGFIEADEIRLGSRVGGRVERVYVKEGQQVRAGDLLVKLEEFDLRSRKAEAAANLTVWQAELTRLQNGFREEEIAQARARVNRLSSKVERLVNGPREEEISAAKLRLVLANAQLERATLSYNRVVSLSARELVAVAREDVDRATEDLRVAESGKQVREQELQLLQKGTRHEEIAEAKAELDEASQAVKLAENGYRPEDVDKARAQVAAAQSAVHVIETQLAELEIRTPVPGIIESLELRPGDLVTPNSPVLALMDNTQLWVRAYVPENRLNLQIGQKFKITVDSFPDEHFEGEVSYVSPQAEFTPSNVQTVEERSKQVFRIKVTLKTGRDKLRSGMAADVWLDRP
jgi:multidrug resistance efflux pump